MKPIQGRDTQYFVDLNYAYLDSYDSWQASSLHALQLLSSISPVSLWMATMKHVYALYVCQL